MFCDDGAAVSPVFVISVVTFTAVPLIETARVVASPLTSNSRAAPSGLKKSGKELSVLTAPEITLFAIDVIVEVSRALPPILILSTFRVPHGKAIEPKFCPDAAIPLASRPTKVPFNAL